MTRQTPPPKHALLDAIKEECSLKNDLQLAAHLQLGRDTISRIRHKKRAVSKTHKYNIALNTGFDFAKIERLLAEEV